MSESKPTDESPLVISIIVPVFNTGEYLVEALESIRNNQVGGLELEVLLVNDCSTDAATIEILQNAENDKRVRVIHQPKNGGPAKARNAGIRHATGNWIAFLDADDLFAPGTMKIRMDAIKQNPNARWFAGDMLEMPRRNELEFTNHYERLTMKHQEIQPGILNLGRVTRDLVHSFPPLFGSMLIKRDLFLETGLLNENLNYAEDNLFTWTASCHADLYWIKTPCLYLRRHHESMTKNKLRHASEGFKADLIALDDPRFAAFKKDIRWHLTGVLRVACAVYLEFNMPFKALKTSLHALMYGPNDMRNIRFAANSLASIFYRK